MSKFTWCGGGGRSHYRRRVENREERITTGVMFSRAEGTLIKDAAARDWKTKGERGQKEVTLQQRSFPVRFGNQGN